MRSFECRPNVQVLGHCRRAARLLQNRLVVDHTSGCYLLQRASGLGSAIEDLKV